MIIYSCVCLHNPYLPEGLQVENVGFALINM